MTLNDYCVYLGWDTRELARQVGIDEHTAGNARRGVTISARVARKIADRLSQELGQPVHVGDIDGLSVR